jgi:hypothetical protein
MELIELEIRKKLERVRLQREREEQRGQPARKTDRQEFDEERHVHVDDVDYPKLYFHRERFVLEQSYGEDWKRFLQHPQLAAPRKKFYVEERRRDSSAERRRQKELAAKAKKKKGGSIFRK